MKTILSFGRPHYLKRVGTFLAAIALIAGMAACDGAGYNLTMAVDPAVGGTATDLTNASPYTEGAAVSIEAVAAACYRFVNWTTSAGGTFADPNDPTTIFTMPAENVTVTANFEPESSGCVDFEDLSLGTQYNVGDTFVDTCTVVAIGSFQWSNGQWTDDGHAGVVNLTMAGCSGQEMEVNNVNLDFAIACAEAMSLLFGEYGGNLNIEINGDSRNFNDFQDIDGATIGGVDVSVSIINVGGNDYIGNLTLSGTMSSTIDSFAIGGQELYIDHVCIAYPFEPTSRCVTFEDLLLETQYDVGGMFTEGCVVVEVGPFWSNGGWYYGGHADVENLGCAGGSGQEMVVNNVNLGFAYLCPWDGLSLLFGEYGGNLNIMVNCHWRNFDNFEDIDGATIGGVDVSVVGGSGNDNGSLTLSGIITSFAIGGQELCIDDVCMNITA